MITESDNEKKKQTAKIQLSTDDRAEYFSTPFPSKSLNGNSGMAGLLGSLPTPKSRNEVDKHSESKKRLLPIISNNKMTNNNETKESVTVCLPEKENIKTKSKEVVQSLVPDYDDSDDFSDEMDELKHDKFLGKINEDYFGFSKQPEISCEFNAAPNIELTSRTCDDSKVTLGEKYSQQAGIYSYKNDNNNNNNDDNEYNNNNNNNTNNLEIMSQLSVNESFDDFIPDAIEKFSEVKIDDQKIEQLQISGYDSQNNLQKVLDNDSIKRLTGRKTKTDNIKIIEVNRQDLLTNDIEYLKSITQEQEMVYTGGVFGGNAKRKNQITHLALQAKQDEIMLKNKWARSREARKNSKMRYGFM